jgi:DNA-binding PadR family transcriptional regulator
MSLRPNPESLLPLSPAVFQILIALGNGGRYGYSIMQDDELRATGRLRLSPGTLYSAVKRMLKGGLIEEATGAASDPFDTRRYYRITEYGRRVAQAEANRLIALIELARARNLIET